MANGKLQDFYKTNGVDTVFNCEGPSLTRQEFAEECDINSLMARYDTHVIGGPGNLAPMEPMYVDFASMPGDLMGYIAKMDEAQNAFMSLPAVVRKEFDNSAVEFLAFASDPGNLDQMRAWGLAPPAEAPRVEPVAAPSPVAPSAPAAPAGASTHVAT